MQTIQTSTTDSSSLASVTYSLPQRTLDIEFRNGEVYRYFDVPAVTYDEMLAAPSKGRYFHQSIRAAYAYKRLSGGVKEAR